MRIRVQPSFILILHRVMLMIAQTSALSCCARPLCFAVTRLGTCYCLTVPNKISVEIGAKQSKARRTCGEGHVVGQHWLVQCSKCFQFIHRLPTLDIKVSHNLDSIITSLQSILLGSNFYLLINKFSFILFKS